MTNPFAVLEAINRYDAVLEEDLIEALMAAAQIAENNNQETLSTILTKIAEKALPVESY